ncbi:MAG: DUF4013 domain-containing protein [bacterium]
MKKQQLDFETAVFYFFRLPDWKRRAAIIGGPVAVFMIIMIFPMQFIGLIPFLGWIVQLLFMILYYAVLIITTIYISGYMLEVAAKVKKNQDPGTIVVEEYQSKLLNGVKYFGANFIFMIPYIVLIILAFVILFTTVFSNINSEKVSGFLPLAMVIYLVLFAFALLYIIIVTIYFQAAAVNFLKLNRFSAFFEFKENWEILKRNLLNFIIMPLILLVVGLVAAFAMIFAEITIFCCIGIVLFPMVFAIIFVYQPHVSGHLLGQIARFEEEK